MAKPGPERATRPEFNYDLDRRSLRADLAGCFALPVDFAGCLGLRANLADWILVLVFWADRVTLRSALAS